MKNFAWGLATLALLGAPARAVLPGEQLADVRLEARARSISTEIRCVVCQNQSIDDSDAPLAHDLRVIVRERLTAGATDAQTKKYLVDRYGNYVLLKPPFERETYVLWLGPAVFAVFGLAMVGAYLARRRRVIAPPLTAEDLARYDQILRRHSGESS